MLTRANFYSAPATSLRKWGRSLALVLWLVFVAHLAPSQADGIPAPALKTGQFVYTVPPNFDPPLIGQAGLREIEQNARQLNFPYYVVIVKDYGGSTTQELSDAVDELVESWGRNPRFNRATSSLAVLSYSPRKYRFLAGSTWRARLGLEGQGGQRFVDIFSSYTQGSSKDPKTGIIESMKALDAFVFENTDPKRIARRAKAARQAAEAARQARAQQQLREAASALDNQIDHMETLLSQRQFLPADTSSPRAALTRAKAARISNNPAALLAAARDLQGKADRLGALMDEKRRVYRAQAAAQERARQAALEAQRNEQRRQELHRTRVFALRLGVLLLLGGLLFWHWRRFSALSTLFREKTTAWDEALLNAANNHARFFEERQNVTELAATSGKTREKYEEVTREIGVIYPTIEAMRDRVARCKQLFGQGSFFRLQPLREALTLLDAEFEFDTQTMNRKSLFEPPVRIIKIKPAELQQQLQRQYAENIADWDELMQALQLRETIAQDAFPSHPLTKMLDVASGKGIPHRWLSSHPLFGDEASDRRFYDDVNALRLGDPLAYKHKIDAAVQIQTELKGVLARLIAALALVESKRVRVLPAYGETVVTPPDDPALTLASAFRAEERLAGFLATRTQVEDVEEQARLAAELYQSALEQAATLQAAIKGAQSDTENLEARLDSIGQLQLRAQSRLQEAQTIHADTGAAAAVALSGRQWSEVALGLLQSARRLLDEKRHLEAHKAVQQANGHLASAEHDLNQCLRFCEELDEQKRAYDLQLASLAAAREEAQSSLRRYGRNQRLDGFGGFHLSGPANYGQLTIQINDYRQRLEDEVRRARRDFEEEQAQLEREREAQRQRERDEQRRRSSASSSSSGSSWGSSSTSSSSGSSTSSSSGSSWSGKSSSSSGTDW